MTRGILLLCPYEMFAYWPNYAFSSLETNEMKIKPKWTKTKRITVAALYTTDIKLQWSIVGQHPNEPQHELLLLIRDNSKWFNRASVLVCLYICLTYECGNMRQWYAVRMLLSLGCWLLEWLVIRAVQGRSQGGGGPCRRRFEGGGESVKVEILICSQIDFQITFYLV